MTETTVDLANVDTTASPNGKTSYMVLRSDGPAWIPEKTIEAVSATQAIRKLGQEGTFVAIPARSFKPSTVKSETKTVLTLT